MQTMLHLVCGKIASGKSTLTHQLAQAPNTVLIAEDHLLAKLYPDEIHTVADYAARVGRLRAAIEDLVVQLLKNGCSVVLDFPANTVSSRAWMKTLIERSGADHRLHYLDVSDDECKRRLRARNAAQTHAFQTSDAQFDQITRYFEPPRPEEGFNMI